jgi:hypothetical protein
MGYYEAIGIRTCPIITIPGGPLPDDSEGFLRGVERGLNIDVDPELLLADAADV